MMCCISAMLYFFKCVGLFKRQWTDWIWSLKSSRSIFKTSYWIIISCPDTTATNQCPFRQPSIRQSCVWHKQTGSKYKFHLWIFNLSSELKKEASISQFVCVFTLAYLMWVFQLGPSGFSLLPPPKKKPTTKTCNLYPRAAERPWDITRRGNWINLFLLRLLLSRLADTRGPLLVELRRSSVFWRIATAIPFPSQSGCFLHFQQQREPHEHTETPGVWGGKKPRMEIVPHNLSVKVMHISDRHTQAEAADWYRSPSLRAPQS